MKAVLPYDASPAVRRVIESADLEIAIVAERDADGLKRQIADAQVLLHVLAPVTAAIMDAGPSLKLVQKIGVGVDAIDREHAKRAGIAVCNMPGTNTVAVAELALGLMLACLRRIVPIDGALRAGNGWPAAEAHLDAAAEIDGACVGLIGYGAVARRLAGVLRAMGASVIAHSPRARGADVDLVSLDELLARADIVSLHVPLVPETRNLLDAVRIARMKRGAIVVNTARGPLIDEAALVAALREGHIAAAGLDVFAEEPAPAGNPLFGLPNVVVTPHVAWMTAGTWKRSLDVVVENCRRLAAGEPLLHRVA